jgi:membrane fusion protein, copper/silver efflux system
MARLFIFLIPLTLILFPACGETEREQALQEERQQQLQMQTVETTPEFNEQMAALLEHYFDLKDALVESDAEQARELTDRFQEEAEAVDPAGLNEETLAIWVSFSEVMVNSSNELTEQDDVDDQRYHFEYISNAMIDMVDTFRPVGYEVYHQSCPMVRDGSADWLSREEEIRNPYHGDRMMNCGEVIRQI